MFSPMIEVLECHEEQDEKDDSPDEDSPAFVFLFLHPDPAPPVEGYCRNECGYQ